MRWPRGQQKADVELQQGLCGLDHMKIHIQPHHHSLKKKKKLSSLMGKT